MAEYLEDVRRESVGALDVDSVLRFVDEAAREARARFEDGSTYTTRDGAAAAIGAVLQGIIAVQTTEDPGILQMIMTSEQLAAFSSVFELTGPMQVGYAIIDLVGMVLVDPLDEIPLTDPRDGDDGR